MSLEALLAARTTQPRLPLAELDETRASDGYTAPVSLRAAGDRRAAGTAVIWHHPTEMAGADGSRWIEIFNRGSLYWNNQLFCCREHRPELLLSTLRARTLTVKSTDRGLEFETTFPDTDYGRDAWAMFQAGELRGASMRFRVDPDGDSWLRTTDPPTRTIYKARLIEISLVVDPAQAATTELSRVA